MKNKTAGIMTFHASHNNGSMLQAYALQKVLKEQFGLENEIINFSNKSQQRQYAILYMPYTLKQLIRNFLNLRFYSILKKRFNDYVDFSAKYLRVSENLIDNDENLAKCEGNYDMLICGSDQIWNTKANDADKAYFLSFAKNRKKIAYAVSFGATNINTVANVEEYARYVNDFSAISVREYNAQKWLQEITDIPIEITADPTLLLEKKDYLPLCSDSGIKEKYIFWYTITYKKETVKYITEVSKKLGLPIYVIDAKEWTRRNLSQYGIKLAPNGGPGSYLSCIKNADLVLTSSFHGTIFSVMFEKNFRYLKMSSNPNDDRASFLLHQLNLSDRFTELNRLNKLDLEEMPNYDTVKDKIENLKEKSLFFLKSSITEK